MSSNDCKPRLLEVSNRQQKLVAFSMSLLVLVNPSNSNSMERLQREERVNKNAKKLLLLS
jgi:hypothetical protein